jgi:hypothetical protein
MFLSGTLGCRSNGSRCVNVVVVLVLKSDEVFPMLLVKGSVRYLSKTGREKFIINNMPLG